MKKLLVLSLTIVLLTLAWNIVAFTDTKPALEPEEIAQPAQTQNSTAKPIDTQPVQASDEAVQVQSKNSSESSVTPPSPSQKSSSVAFQLNWLSINGGGAISASSPSYQLGLSVGQSVAGAASSPSYQMGIGFWYGAATGAPVCAAAKGDMNGVGGITPADAVLMLNCVFLGNGTGTVGGDCNLCYSDLNCLGGLTPADAVIQLNYVFLGTPLPC